MKSILERVRIAGIAAAVPQKEEDILNGPYSTPEGRAKFVASTGIARRRLCPEDQWCSDLAEAAAKRLMGELDWDPSSIGLLVFVTQTPDLKIPATACLLQNRLGLPTSCAAFDVNLGCSGYVYGLKITGSMLSGRGCRRALLLAGDTPAKGPLPSKRSSVPPIFGDAATATALEWSEDAPEVPFDLRTDGTGWRSIMELRPGGRPPFTEETFQFETTAEGYVLVGTARKMRGEEVFSFAAREVPSAIRAMLDQAGMDASEVDAYVLHQANAMINEFIRKRVGLEKERFPETLSLFGNTSSASIPITLVARMRERLQTAPATLLLCGFGVGLSWGTALWRTDKMICPPLVEL